MTGSSSRNVSNLLETPFGADRGCCDIQLKIHETNSEIYAYTDHYVTYHYVTYHSHLDTVEPDNCDAGLYQVSITLTGDVQCLATNPAFNCVLAIIEDVSGDAQGSVSLSLSRSCFHYCMTF
ncbi:hypothetical protein TNCV_1771781 [Trichonephila clavipes]|nr:hypothetical protein TNCV_1771781 [Trichonephila clavipes]